MKVKGYEIEPHANLRSANLRGADLRDADLSGAVLCGANMDGAKITYRQQTVIIRFEPCPETG